MNIEFAVASITIVSWLCFSVYSELTRRKILDLSLRIARLEGIQQAHERWESSQSESENP